MDREIPEACTHPFPEYGSIATYDAAMDFAPATTPYVAKPLRLRPFRAVMLAPDRVGDPASARALARPYREVAARLAHWITQDRAVQDTSPALYLHEYTAAGLTVRGLVGALAMSPRATTLADRAVWPHEAIHPEQAGELADRMFDMGLNPAPILLVHHGHAALRQFLNSLTLDAADWNYLDRAGHRQRIWAIRQPSDLAMIDSQLEDAHCLLADGHHRYAAYLRLQEEHSGTPWEAGLAMLVDQLDTPLFLGAIHRTLTGTNLSDISRAAVSIGASVEEKGRTAALAALDQRSLVLTDGETWRTIQPDALDGRTIVAWLHESLLPLLDTKPHAHHHHSVDEALAGASAQKPAVLLPSPDFTHVQSLVEAGGLLPEKATSFQPKPPLGALMRSIPGG